MPTILGANSVRETGYNVDNSLRFDAASSSKITRTITENLINLTDFRIF